MVALLSLGVSAWIARRDRAKLDVTVRTAVISLLPGTTRNVVAVQAVFLDPETASKADVECPKKTFGPAAGGAVRLAAHGPRLAITEGIETGLSVLQACPGLPVWASVGTAGFLSLIVPPGVSDLTVAADGDEAGEAAALKAAQRFVREVSRVKIARPPDGYGDFNDVHQQALGKAVGND